MTIFNLIRRKPQSQAAELLRQERQRRISLQRQLKREATHYQRLILQRLNQLNICYRYKKKERDWFEAGLQSIKFLRVAANPEAIYMQVDTRKLPRGISISKLEDADILKNLSASCQRPVKVEHGQDGHDFWYVVERLAGVGGIPAKVNYRDMITMMPKTATRLTIPIGVGANKRTIFASLDDMEQILVGGARGMGKSNFVDAAICTLIQHNTPETLRMVMIDLKIVELTKYTRIPHLIMPVVVEEDGIIPALRACFNEIERRMKMFRPDEEREPLCVNITGWNYKFPHKRLPYWLLIIDELAEIKAVGGDTAMFLLQRVGALGRAAGIYGIVATQRPSSSIMPGEVKAHYPTRVAFSCADGPSSMTLIDNYDAVRLPGVGHFIFGYRDQRIHLKAPYLGPKMVEEIVAKVLVEKPVFEEIQIHTVKPEDMFRYALQNLDGDFSWRKIWKEFRRYGVTREEIQKLGKKMEILPNDKTLDDKIIVIDGQEYIMLPSDGGKQPRHLALMVGNSYGRRSEDSPYPPHPETGKIPEDFETVSELELPELPAAYSEIGDEDFEMESEPGPEPELALVAPSGNGDQPDEELNAMLLGALDMDSDGAIDEDCEACRAANDGWCPGTCETIKALNRREMI